MEFRRDPDATTAIERVTVASPRIPAPTVHLPIPRGLAATLLPGERVTFGSTPHPVVLVRPLVLLVAVAVAFAVGWQRVPVDRHVVLEVVAALAALATIWSLASNALYLLGSRVVATNRRIFSVRGIIIRRVAPLGNTVLASSTLSQGVLGRMYGYGSIDVRENGKRRSLFRDMREAAALYRECQAVANGVDGDTWTPAVRQTIIP
jgi:hypothetical protein